VHARFNASVWLKAGQYLALAAQIPAKQKSGCPRLPKGVVGLECALAGGPQARPAAHCTYYSLNIRPTEPANRHCLATPPTFVTPSLPTDTRSFVHIQAYIYQATRATTRTQTNIDIWLRRSPSCVLPMPIPVFAVWQSSHLKLNASKLQAHKPQIPPAETRQQHLRVPSVHTIACAILVLWVHVGQATS
jgi:hypothetical protein